MKHLKTDTVTNTNIGIYENKMHEPSKNVSYTSDAVAN